MFRDIVSNEETKSFLQRELSYNRKSGTYLFYGEDRELQMRFALALAKGLNCENIENDFCGTCETCKRIDHLTHGDLDIIEDPNGVKIDQVRKMIYEASTTSYEGGKKVFIIKDIDKMKKEASNGLLKIIEEPKDGTFFIMLSNSLNLLGTIKSRSIILPINKQKPEDLNVNEEEYKFFLGRAIEIEKYLEISDEKYLKEPLSYETIGENIKKYISTGEFKYKINVYKAIRDFVKNKKYIDKIDRMFFCDEILRGGGDRNFIKEIIVYSIELLKCPEKMEDFLILKGLQRYPINIKNLLITFFVKD
ncbi:MAG: ATPase [Cetobacterium sp.]|nr:ATPase [Cetobacterium sp.]